eukprot:gene24034-9611_t
MGQLSACIISAGCRRAAELSSLAVLAVLLHGAVLASGAAFGNSVSTFGVASLGKYNYVLYSSPQIFEAAEVSCRTLAGGHLADASSDVEWRLISSMVNQYYASDTATFDAASPNYGACLWIGFSSLQASPDPMAWTSGESVTWIQSSFLSHQEATPALGLVRSGQWLPKYNGEATATRLCSTNTPSLPPTPEIGPLVCLATEGQDLFCLPPHTSNVQVSWSDVLVLCPKYGMELAWISSSSDQLLLEALLNTSTQGLWTQGLCAGVGNPSTDTSIVNYNGANASHLNAAQVASPPSTTTLTVQNPNGGTQTLPTGACLGGGGCALALTTTGGGGRGGLQYMDAGTKLGPVCRTLPEDTGPVRERHIPRVMAGLELTLEMDYQLISSEQEMALFTRSLDRNLAASLYVPSGDVAILSVVAGSVVVTASVVLPPDVRTADQGKDYLKPLASAKGGFYLRTAFRSTYGISSVSLEYEVDASQVLVEDEGGGDEKTEHLGWWLGFGLGLGLPMLALLVFLIFKSAHREREGYVVQKDVAMTAA